MKPPKQAGHVLWMPVWLNIWADTNESARTPDTVSLIPSPRTGAPYLARFSRDVGFHCFFPLTLDSSDSLHRHTRWNPTSREKRARYGAPDLGEGTRGLFLLLLLGTGDANPIERAMQLDAIQASVP